MQLKSYSAADYASAQRALLPPGAAFDWPAGGFGDALLVGIGTELARVGADAQKVLDTAISKHRPASALNWHFREYLKIAEAAIAGVVETKPRSVVKIGSKIGQRLWSGAAGQNFPVELMQIELMRPARVGCRIGNRLWGERGIYVMRVRYFSSAVDPKPLWDALAGFKQAHVFLWFEDITGAGGHYGQN